MNKKIVLSLVFLCGISTSFGWNFDWNFNIPLIGDGYITRRSFSVSQLCASVGGAAAGAWLFNRYLSKRTGVAEGSKKSWKSMLLPVCLVGALKANKSIYLGAGFDRSGLVPLLSRVYKTALPSAIVAALGCTLAAMSK